LNQAELMRYVIEVLEAQELNYMVVGSFASAVYGEPRLTHDIDIVVDLSAGQVTRLCAAFPEPEFYVSDLAAREATEVRGQFNVIHPASGNKIDFMIARNDAWGRSQLERRTRRTILPERESYLATPEDVILGKLWYYEDGGSDKHLRDIAGILQVSGDQVDRDYVEHWAEQLGLLRAWQAAVRRLEAPGEGRNG
jgi:predicted nucleotidyltransferase